MKAVGIMYGTARLSFTTDCKIDFLHIAWLENFPLRIRKSNNETTEQFICSATWTKYHSLFEHIQAMMYLCPIFSNVVFIIYDQELKRFY